MIDPRIYIAAGAAVLCFGAGWGVNGWRLGSKVSGLEAEHSALVAEAARTALNAQRALDDQRDALAKALASIDSLESAELKKAQDETKRLRTCLANGTCGLRVNAACPSASRDVSETTAGGGLDHDGASRLAPAAERDYFALRDGVASQRRQLIACQRILSAERSGGALTAK